MLQKSDLHSLLIVQSAPSSLRGGGGSVSVVTGGEAEISSYTDEERKAFASQSLYPRELDVPTTSKYARGEGDSSSSATTDGIIAFKNKNLYVQNLQNIKHNGNWGNTWSKWLKAQEPSVTIQIYSKFLQKATLSILTKDDIKLKKIEVSLEKGFNTINYDLSITEKGKNILEKLTEGLIITKKKNDKFYLIKGNYQLKITTQNSGIKTPIIIE